MDWTIQFDEAVSRYLPDLKVVCDEPMSRHTTFRIGGPAKRMAYPSSREQLVLLLNFAEKSGADPLVIGNGSNLLAPDEGLNRLVIDTSAHLNRVEQTAEHIIRADAGATLARTADLCLQAGPHRAGICPRHPRHGGRRRLHERRGLRRRDEAGAALCFRAVPGSGCPNPYL